MSIDEKAFDKTKHPFMINILSKLAIQKIHLNTIKAIYDKSTLSIVLNMEELEAFS